MCGCNFARQNCRSVCVVLSHSNSVIPILGNSESQSLLGHTTSPLQSLGIIFQNDPEHLECCTAVITGISTHTTLLEISQPSYLPLGTFPPSVKHFPSIGNPAAPADPPRELHVPYRGSIAATHALARVCNTMHLQLFCSSTCFARTHPSL